MEEIACADTGYGSDVRLLRDEDGFTIVKTDLGRTTQCVRITGSDKISMDATAREVFTSMTGVEV